MKLKKIALLLAVFPALALADDGVTIYGRIGANFSNYKSYSTTPTTPNTGAVQAVNDNTSRLGFKGTETLGNGLSAIWQVESRIHVDGSGSDTLGSRDTFVGLNSNSLGKIRFGYLSNYANLDMELYDPASYSKVAGSGAYTERLDGRIKNAVRYDSPVWSGFSFTTVWGADETRTSSTSQGSTNNQTFNLGLSYENSGFVTKFNYQTSGDARKLSQISQANATPTTSNSSSFVKDWWRLETGYISEPYFIVGGFQKVHGYLGVNNSGQFVDSGSVVYNITALNARLAANNTNLTSTATSIAGTEVTAKEAFLTLGYNIGKFLPYFEYVKGYDLSLGGSTISKTGYSQYVVGTIYTVSKTVKTYASYGYANWGGSGVKNESSLSLGLSKWF